VDSISCHKIPCEVEIGFKDSEQGIKQTLLVDFIAKLDPIASKNSDQVSGIKLDYFEAYQMIKEELNTKKFNLIETVGEHLAHKLLERFEIHGVTVEIQKKPHGMEDTEGVVYTCYRGKNA